jgi:hypothetical protein
MVKMGGNKMLELGTAATRQIGGSKLSLHVLIELLPPE